MSGAIPKLRFPEFKETWHCATLGDFMSFKNGVNAEKGQYGSGTKFINVMDIIATGPITHERIIGKVEVSKRDLEKNEVRYGDLLFQRSSETREEVGQSNVYLDKDHVATFGGFVIRGRAVADFDPLFFDSLLRTASVRSDMTSRSGGSTRYNIGQEALALVPVTVPQSLHEQQKIASFLGAVDSKISGLRRKEAALVRFKAGLMQKLFSQKLRFTRDDGSAFPDWKIIPLYEIATIDKGEQLNRDTLDENKAYPVINGGTGPSGFHDSFNTPAETITVSEGGNSCGYVAWQDKPFWRGGHCYAVNPSTSKVSKTFLFQALKSMEKEIMRLRVGSGLPNIQKSDLMKVVVLLPQPEEQRKIADALSAMDAKITAVRSQISQMETFKKGLLQQMFV